MIAGIKRPHFCPDVLGHLASDALWMLQGDPMRRRSGHVWQSWGKMDPRDLDALLGYMRHHGADVMYGTYYRVTTPYYRLIVSFLDRDVRVELVDFLAWEFGGDALTPADETESEKEPWDE